jgi:hypothetical protein
LKYSGEWHNAETNPPKEKGQYLVLVGGTGFDKLFYKILRYTTDLYDVDDYDFYQFKGKKQAGWYVYDSEWGYSRYNGVKYWTELPIIPYVKGELE